MSLHLHSPKRADTSRLGGYDKRICQFRYVRKDGFEFLQTIDALESNGWCDGNLHVKNAPKYCTSRVVEDEILQGQTGKLPH